MPGLRLRNAPGLWQERRDGGDMTSDYNDLPILVTTFGVMFGALMLYQILGQLNKIVVGLDKVTRGNDLIIENLDENLEALVWQTSEIQNRIHSIDERVSRFSQNQHEQFVGELKELLDENRVPMDKADD